MEQNTLICIIQEQTRRALWEVGNVIDCIPYDLWNKLYCEMPLWKHVYHMLHSLDLWFINPRSKEFCEPAIHKENLNNLDAVTDGTLTREDIIAYYAQITDKIECYLAEMDDYMLLEYPQDCEYTKFTLILAQFRHLHSHMGMIMGFIIDDTGLWPRVVGLESPIPSSYYEKYC